MKDPVLTVLDLLQNNWDTTNTSLSHEPRIYSGWLDKEAQKSQVTVSHPNAGPIFGRTTPFSGIDPSGSGPVQEISGTVSVNCWSARDWEDENPKKLTFEFTEEIKRIVQDNTLDATDLRYIGYGGRRFLIQRTAEPPIFRYQVTVRYGHAERP